MRHVARAALLAALFALLAGTARGAQAPIFALKPVGHAELGYYRFALEPCAETTGRVRVVNAGKVAGTAALAVVDATTGATTGAVYETVGGPSDDVGAWLTLAEREIALAPGESRIVSFTLRVPAGARRGQHLGGLVARPVTAASTQEDGAEKHSFRVNVVDQSIIAVQADLPGPARGLLAVRGVQAGGNPGYQTLLIALSNPGERMVKGRGTVVITGAGGEQVSKQEFAIDTFLPRTRIDYPLVMRRKALVPGRYRAEVVLHWNGGQASRTTLPFSVTKRNIEQAYGSKGLAQLPGAEDGGSGGAPVAGGGLLVMLLGFGGVAMYFRRRTRELERRLAAAIPPEPAGEIAVTDTREPAERV